MCLQLGSRQHPHDPYATDPFEVAYIGGRRRTGFHTSVTEILHLIIALGVLSLAFGLYLAGVGYYMDANGLARRAGTGFGLASYSLPQVFLIAFVAIGTGFVLHELMHKFVAQYYGHWAEFRAQMVGLLIPIPLVLFLQVIFAAPGAVIISGWVRKDENGIISAAGPLTNFIIAGIALPFALMSGGGFGYAMSKTVVVANAILGLFNLIPLGPLDGKKVLAWNKSAYLGLLAIGAGLLWYGLTLRA